MRVLALAGAVALAGAAPAQADTCRALEMRLMQLQASGGQTARIHNMLVDRGCQSGRRVAVIRQPSVVVRLQRPQRVRAPVARERNPAPASRDRNPARGSAGGTYRTLCVRRCDGYYFPISFSTTREHFADDQATCRQMCPAGDAELYYHPHSGDGPAEMLSLEEALYTSLPTAFRHLSALDKSCSCGSSASLSVTAGLDTAQTVQVEEIALLPKPRPEPGEDPETLANRDGAITPASLARLAEVDHGERRSVRIVGGVDEPLVLLTSVPN